MKKIIILISLSFVIFLQDVSAEKASNSYQKGTAIVIDGPANLRSSANGTIILEIPDYSAARIIETKKNWYKIDYRDKTGWIFHKNIDVKATSSYSPGDLIPSSCVYLREVVLPNKLTINAFVKKIGDKKEIKEINESYKREFNYKNGLVDPEYVNASPITNHPAPVHVKKGCFIYKNPLKLSRKSNPTNADKYGFNVLSKALINNKNWFFVSSENDVCDEYWIEESCLLGRKKEKIIISDKVVEVSMLTPAKKRVSLVKALNKMEVLWDTSFSTLNLKNDQRAREILESSCVGPHLLSLNTLNSNKEYKVQVKLEGIITHMKDGYFKASIFHIGKNQKKKLIVKRTFDNCNNISLINESFISDKMLDPKNALSLELLWVSSNRKNKEEKLGLIRSSCVGEFISEIHQAGMKQGKKGVITIGFSGTDEDIALGNAQGFSATLAKNKGSNTTSFLYKNPHIVLSRKGIVHCGKLEVNFDAKVDKRRVQRYFGISK